MSFEEVSQLIQEKFPNTQVLEDEVLSVESQDLLQLCTFLQESEKLYVDQLMSITGMHNLPKEDSLEVIYNFNSIPLEHRIAIKVKLQNQNEEMPSLCTLWKGANWLEREVFDLFGIRFSNHPDLRRILLPANWEGFPLRKDYQTQEYFHGIKVDY